MIACVNHDYHTSHDCEDEGYCSNTGRTEHACGPTQRKMMQIVRHSSTRTSFVFLIHLARPFAKGAKATVTRMHTASAAGIQSSALHQASVTMNPAFAEQLSNSPPTLSTSPNGTRSVLLKRGTNPVRAPIPVAATTSTTIR